MTDFNQAPETPEANGTANAAEMPLMPEPDVVDAGKFSGPRHRCTLGRDDLKEIAKKLLPKTYTIYVYAITVIFVFLAVACLVAGGWELALIFFFGAVMIQVIMVFQKRKIIRINENRILEVTGGDCLDYSFAFGEDEVHIYNAVTGARADLQYKFIKKLIHTQNFEVIITSGRQYLPIDKRVEGAEECIEYLEEHMKH